MQVTDETELVFETWSGSRYWIKSGKVKRLNHGHEKRADGEWLTLYNRPDIEIGRGVYMILEPLESYGVDDYGTYCPEAILTQRMTSEVVGIEVQDEDGQA